ncbi:hypothetical protein AXF42_Ash009871 [Apostasia shenzhenica]|uniref:Uncharacterized protein n=1 Tax=Apostasia shenzhenica TaxID=1088818 RepID=A0A2I0AC62_9ASPA|nr:hypothetical protein AXF42_Ash009871 [Apostasia shenzhenica]
MRYLVRLKGAKKIGDLGHGLVGRVSSGCPVKVHNSDGRVALYPNPVRRIRPLLGGCHRNKGSRRFCCRSGMSVELVASR